MKTAKWRWQLLLALCTLIVAITLTACGNKQPLYLPSEVEKTEDKKKSKTQKEPGKLPQ